MHIYMMCNVVNLHYYVYIAGQVLCIYCIAENVAGQNLDKFSYLDYLGEKTLANSLFQINMEIKGSVKLRESDWPSIH